VEALRERAEAGVDVLVVSENPAARALFADGPSAVAAPPEETAIWSAESAMAAVLVQVTRDGIATLLG
jgi:hypothetical protein